MAKSPAVLIVGAGPAGLTLALDLARRNVDLRIIDKAPAPFRGSRGKGLQPRTQEVFEDLGVLDRIAGRAAPYPPLRIYGPAGAVDAPFMEARAASPAEPYGQPLMLPQNLTEGVLRDRLAELGVVVEFGSALVGFEETDTSVEAKVETLGLGPEVVTATYLVGADGGASFVRKSLGVGFPGERLPGRGLVADLLLDGLGRDAWHVWNADDRPRMLSLCPLAGTELFQLQAALPLDAETALSDPALADLIAERTGRRDIGLRGVLWRSAFEPSARLADRYRVGRVFLAGDAAHVHPPTGGQGLNTSIQDAYNLGWKLDAVVRGAPPALLDSYEAERRPIGADVLGHATALMRSGEARRGRENHELDLGYFDSPLALEARTRRPGRLRTGARAPDAPCRGAGGQPTRLFEVFRGPQATLLGYEVGEAHAPSCRGLQVRRVGRGGDLQDDGGHILAAYDLDPGDWVLVRPDGYVGAIIPRGDRQALDDGLTRIGLPTVEATHGPSRKTDVDNSEVI